MRIAKAPKNNDFIQPSLVFHVVYLRCWRIVKSAALPDLKSKRRLTIRWLLRQHHMHVSWCSSDQRRPIVSQRSDVQTESAALLTLSN